MIKYTVLYIKSVITGEAADENKTHKHSQYLARIQR